MAETILRAWTRQKGVMGSWIGEKWRWTVRYCVAPVRASHYYGKETAGFFQLPDRYGQLYYVHCRLVTDTSREEHSEKWWVCRWLLVRAAVCFNLPLSQS